MEKAMSVGVIIFDNAKGYNPEKDNSGYSCLPGQEPIRIFGTHELPTNVRWLTNISLDVAAASSLQNRPVLLNTNFLRTSVNSMITELGLKGLSATEQSFILAGIFNNVMRQANTLLGIDEPPLFSLSQAIPATLGHYLVPMNDDVKEASAKVAQNVGQCEIKAGKEAVFASVLIPRQRHASNILTTGLPFGRWRHVEKADLPLKPQRIDWVCTLNKPALCQIKINRVKKKYQQLVNYGAGAGLIDQKGNMGNSSSVMNGHYYACSNEVAFLSNIADIVIEDVFICESILEARYALPSTNKMAALSYSYGLLAENIWSSLDRGEDGKKLGTPATAWLHAEDRIACLKVAAELSRSGYKVLSYGYGRITLALEPDMIRGLTKDCLRLMLVPPIGIDTNDIVSIPENPSGEALLIGLFAQANINVIMDMDNAFTEQCCNHAANVA